MSEPGYTALFCDCTRDESHSGATTGTLAQRGFSADQLRQTAVKLAEMGHSCEIVELSPHCPPECGAAAHPIADACVLVIRGEGLLKTWADDTYAAMHNKVEFDTFTLLRGKVCKAHSRHLAYVHGNEKVDPIAELGVHTTLHWSAIPALSNARKFLSNLFETGAIASACLLKYPNLQKCGIGYHGDAERRLSIVWRLGPASSSAPLVFRWFQQGLPVSAPVPISLAHGDFCITSEKANGYNWKSRTVATLRHRTGFLAKDMEAMAETKASKNAERKKRKCGEA